MPYYLSQHIDYTDASLPQWVDDPAEPRLIVANDATEAARKSWEMDLKEGGVEEGTSLDDVLEETTLVKLDPLFELMRTAGWAIIPPKEG